jgi:hypothetical protein
MPNRVRVASVPIAVVCAFALAACTASGDVKSAAPTVSTAPSAGPFDKFSVQIGAANTVLNSCIARFAASAQRDWCKGSQMYDLVTEVTTDLKKDIASRADPSQFADVSTAITNLEKSAGTVRQECDHVSGTGLNCTAAFDGMMDDWRRLLSAVRYL